MTDKIVMSADNPKPETQKTQQPDSEWGCAEKGTGGWQNFDDPRNMRGRGRSKNGILR